MNAWADGLNYYLETHPQVKPRVITRFEPWMALSFTEGSIGGDIERVSLQQLEAFYGNGPKAPQAAALHEETPPEPTGSNGFAIAPSNSASRKALLWVNPHTSFFFRAEAQMTSEEGLNAYGAITWGQFFVYQGFNSTAGWMHTTSSGVDNIDEYLETVQRNGDALLYTYGTDRRPVDVRTIVVPYKTASGMASRAFTVYRTHHGPVVREEGGRWVSVRADAGSGEGAHPELHAHEGDELPRLQGHDGAARQLVEQHGVRRRRGEHRVLLLELRAEARSVVRLDEAGGWQQPGHRVEGTALGGRAARTC